MVGWRSLLETEPTVAVIVPVLNEQAVLPGMVDMLLHLPVDGVVIVDGGSDDGSRELLRDSTLTWIDSMPGRARQMNAGSTNCKCDILLFIHADMILYSSHIEALKKRMACSGYVGGRFDVQLSGAHPIFRVIEWMINVRSRLTRISTGDQCIFVRRTSFERLGGFPEQPLMEDVEFSKRLKKSGRVACLTERVVTSSRRWEQFGILKTVVLMWKLRFLYWAGVAPDRLAKLYSRAR